MIIPSVHFALTSKLSDPHDRIYDVKALKERRHSAVEKMVVLPETDQ